MTMTMTNNLFLTLTILINDVKYETEIKRMETIQNNNIMSITQANQTKKRCIRIKIVNILYMYNTAHFFIEIAQIL